MRCKLTVSIEEELIKEIEETRNKKTEHSRVTEDKSHFIEKLLEIGLRKYIEKQRFFDTLDLNNIDLSKVNF